MTKSCPSHNVTDSNVCGEKKRDILLWSTLLFVCIGYFGHLMSAYIGAPPFITWSGYWNYSHAVFDLMNTMWWGVLFGIIFMGILGRIPRDFVMTALGTGSGLKGIVRATVAGVALDLCSHGILMVGAKLYERGASVGQLMAFLIASPWNSLSLTLILWSLVGFKWMITFLLLSMAIGVISGLVFERLVALKILPGNPNQQNITDGFRFWPEAKQRLKNTSFKLSDMGLIFWEGLKESRMILRWLFLGVVIAALLRTFMSVELFQDWFGPTVLGLGVTLIAATVIEVCSEGSTPIAADILTRGGAPGNSFAFLMTGVSTDYTEIMILKEVTKSWKITLFLPLITLPQIIVLALVLNL